MQKPFILLASAVAVLFIPLTSVSAKTERTGKNLCEQLPTLLSEVNFEDQAAFKRLSNIKRACNMLAQLREEKTLERFRALRNVVKNLSVSFAEIGALEKEVVVFELQEAAQKFLWYFGSNYNAVAGNLKSLRASSLNLYTKAKKNTLQDFLYDEYGGLSAFMGHFKKVRLAFSEILTYRDKIVLGEGKKSLPDTFWNLVELTRKLVREARFGDARATCGEVRGFLCGYIKDNDLCATP